MHSSPARLECDLPCDLVNEMGIPGVGEVQIGGEDGRIGCLQPVQAVWRVRTSQMREINQLPWLQTYHSPVSRMGLGTRADSI